MGSSYGGFFQTASADWRAFRRPMPVMRMEATGAAAAVPAAIFRNGAASSFNAKQTSVDIMRP